MNQQQPKYKYPKPRKERKEGKKNTDTEAKKYQDIVLSHPIEVTHSIKQEKQRKKLIKEKKISINDPQIKERSKKAVKQW